MILEKNRVFRVWVGYRVPYSILTRKLEKNQVRMYGCPPFNSTADKIKLTVNEFTKDLVHRVQIHSTKKNKNLNYPVNLLSVNLNVLFEVNLFTVNLVMIPVNFFYI